MDDSKYIKNFKNSRFIMDIEDSKYIKKIKCIKDIKCTKDIKDIIEYLEDEVGKDRIENGRIENLMREEFYCCSCHWENEVLV